MCVRPVSAQRLRPASLWHVLRAHRGQAQPAEQAAGPLRGLHQAHRRERRIGARLRRHQHARRAAGQHDRHGRRAAPLAMHHPCCRRGSVCGAVRARAGGEQRGGLALEAPAAGHIILRAERVLRVVQADALTWHRVSAYVHTPAHTRSTAANTTGMPRAPGPRIRASIPPGLRLRLRARRVQRGPEPRTRSTRPRPLLAGHVSAAGPA